MRTNIDEPKREKQMLEEIMREDTDYADRAYTLSIISICISLATVAIKALNMWLMLRSP